MLKASDCFVNTLMQIERKEKEKKCLGTTVLLSMEYCKSLSFLYLKGIQNESCSAVVSFPIWKLAQPLCPPVSAGLEPATRWRAVLNRIALQPIE